MRLARADRHEARRLRRCRVAAGKRPASGARLSSRAPRLRHGAPQAAQARAAPAKSSSGCSRPSRTTAPFTVSYASALRRPGSARGGDRAVSRDSGSRRPRAAGPAPVDRPRAEDSGQTAGGHRLLSRRHRHQARLRRCLLEPRQPQDLPFHRRGHRADARRRNRRPASRSRTAITCASRSARRWRIAREYAESFQLLRARQRAEESRDPLQDRADRAQHPPADGRCARAISSRHGAATAARRDEPIFIVGLPRAGSTLLEQILASHSQVEGTLELPDIPRLVARTAGPRPGSRQPALPGVLADVDRGRPAPYGEKYLADTRIYRTGQAAVHRQDAEQLPPHRAHPPDSAERQDHRCAARADGLLLQQLQTAVRLRPGVHLQPRGHRALLPHLPGAHARTGMRCCPARCCASSTRTSWRTWKATCARCSSSATWSSSPRAWSSTRTSAACAPRAPSRCAGRSSRKASTSGGISSRGWGR